MANQEYDTGKIKRLIIVLKRITLSVQIVPFVFTALYIIDFVAYSWLTESAQALCDMLFYISPLVIAAHLVYSRILNLCRWHRMACVLPLFPQIVSFIDYYIIELSEIESIVTDSLTLVMTILLLISAYPGSAGSMHIAVDPFPTRDTGYA